MKQVALDEAVELLGRLLSNVDEDCPHEHRTRHLEETMMESHDLISRYRESVK